MKDTISPIPYPMSDGVSGKNISQTFQRKSKTPTPCYKKAPPRPMKAVASVRRLFSSSTDQSNLDLIHSLDPSQSVSILSDWSSHSTRPAVEFCTRINYFEKAFEIKKRIGSGYFADVFSVRCLEDGEYYAIKRHREPFKGRADRFRKVQEAVKHMRLPKHPNLVEYFDGWEEHRRLHIQYELCDFSLYDLSTKCHALPEPQVWNILVDILMALNHMHRHNLIHLDVKPENILISRGICKLGDFGLVIDLDNDVADAVEGDPKYMAKELMQGTAAFSKAADIFSLGITMLEVACDIELPSSGPGFHALRSGTIPFSEFGAHLSDDLKGVITAMMRPDASERPTAEQLLVHPLIRPVAKKRRMRAVLIQAMKKVQKFALMFFHWLMVLLLTAVSVIIHNQDPEASELSSMDPVPHIELQPSSSDEDEATSESHQLLSPEDREKSSNQASSLSFAALWPGAPTRPPPGRPLFPHHSLVTPNQSMRPFMSSTPYNCDLREPFFERSSFHTPNSFNRISLKQSNRSNEISSSMCDFSDPEDFDDGHISPVPDVSIGPRNLMTVFDQLENEADEADAD